jgi:hypothetical protein
MLPRMSKGIRLCAAMLLVTPAFAAAQDQAPAPPKQETVTIRVVGGAFEVKGACRQRKSQTARLPSNRPSAFADRNQVIARAKDQRAF